MSIRDDPPEKISQLISPAEIDGFFSPAEVDAVPYREEDILLS